MRALTLLLLLTTACDDDASAVAPIDLDGPRGAVRAPAPGPSTRLRRTGGR
ncbi:MAG: hypothetical protein R3F60_23790 [bacterium]